ncbi:Uma2 family endonuclease [Streptomyces sp. NPDC096310]|uniref:Uma2 family endonuclease n=1 Tax=Streptomyces sp. NPDC096310 TaxID=3366082 RepID=UPI0037F2F8B8
MSWARRILTARSSRIEIGAVFSRIGWWAPSRHFNPDDLMTVCVRSATESGDASACPQNVERPPPVLRAPSRGPDHQINGKFFRRSAGSPWLSASLVPSGARRTPPRPLPPHLTRWRPPATTGVRPPVNSPVPPRTSAARPDGALTPLDHFAGQGEWAPTDGVLMTLEVTSHDRDTARRDRREKRDGYAGAGIPLYLLIDRDAEELVVYTDPRQGAYMSRHTYRYGETVKLPAPVGITLETEKLKDYTR